MQEVLREAIDKRGSSVSNYVDAEGRKGSFQNAHRVYRRTGEPRVKCKTPIKRVVVGGRSSHFCPQCQFQLAPVCGRCFRGVQITDVYCTQCGHDLAEDQTPARLRAYSD